MPVQSTILYKLHGLLLPGAVWITQLTDLTPAPNIEHFTGYAGASTIPSYRGAHGATPDLTFSTPQIATILGLTTGGDGVSSVDWNASNVDLYFRAVKNFGTIDTIGTGTHLRIRLYRSMMAWQKIEAKQGQLATIECRILPTWDGTNVPIVGLKAQTIPAQLLAPTVYTLGPVKLNGTFVDGLQGYTLEQNHEYYHQAGNGRIYPEIAAIEKSDPVLNLDTPDLGHWQTEGVTGTQLTALIAYLTKKEPDLVSNVADATAEHIRFTANDNPCGNAVVDSSSGGIDDPGSLGLRCGLRKSTAATLHPLVVSVAAAIA